MLSRLVRFEARYQARQPASLAAAALLFVLGAFVVTSGFGPANLPFHSSWLVTESLGLLSLVGIFVVGVHAANAALRDVEHRMDGIVLSTPVSKRDHLGSRYLGTVVATMATLAVGALGMIAAAATPLADAERVRGLDLRSYVVALAVIALPNVLFAAAALFAVATTTRSALATHGAAIVLYVLFFVAAALTDSPLMAGSSPGVDSGGLTTLLDPFGFAAFFADTRYWTMAEKQARLVLPTGLLLLNRGLWLAVTAAIGAVTYRAFSFGTRGAQVRRRRAEVTDLATASADASPARLAAAGAPALTAPAPSPTALRRGWAAYASATRQELRVLRSRAFLLLLVVWVGLAATEIHGDVREAEYGAALRPVTGIVVDALRQPLGLLGLVLLIFYGAEIFWREHRHRLGGVLGATPAPAAAIVGAKWTALAAMLVAVTVAAVVPGVLLQLVNGEPDLQPSTYLSLLAADTLPLVWFAGLLLLVQALSPGRYAGMVTTLLLAVALRSAASLGLEHPLWGFAIAVPLRHSEMNGFAADLAPLPWYLLHWAGLATAGALVAAAVWRSLGLPLRDRARALRHVARAPLVAALLVALASGGWIVWNTNVRNRFVDGDQLADWKAEYELRYRSLAAWPRPRVERVDMTVDLFPDEQRYAVRGRFILHNETPASIARLAVSVRREAHDVRLSLPGARTVRRSERFGMHELELSPPLAPGERRDLSFALAVAHEGFPAGEADVTLARNGSFLRSHRLLPALGYRASYELIDPRQRRERGLPPGDGLAALAEAGHLETRSLGRLHLVATISTPVEQLAVAPGTLERSWVEGGRRYAHFRTAAPIVETFAIAAARYDVVRGNYERPAQVAAPDGVGSGAVAAPPDEVAVELYHHPGHGANARRIVDVALATIALCERSFGPYPGGGELRLAEVPSYWPFGGFAMPATVFLGERRALLVADDGDHTELGDLDLVARRVAHEVAHQWWGLGVSPAGVEGATFIVESLTKYTELLLIEQLYGREHLRPYLESELDRYLAGRADEDRAEVPVLRTRSQPYLFYGKGALVLWAIREEIGNDRLNRALRRFFADHVAVPERATTADFLRRLREVTTADEQALLEPWLTEIVLYDLGVESATARRRADGRWDLAVDVAAARRRADAEGNEAPLALREAIELRVADADDLTLVAVRRLLHDGRQRLNLVVDRPPAAVELDPLLTRIDRDRNDNARQVE